MFRVVSRSALPLPDQILMSMSFSPFAWLDIETTGLSPANFHVTLIGCLFPVEHGRELVQIFVETPEDEAEALTAAFSELRRASTVITFNGRRFDLPFLRERSARCGVQMPTMRHRDLLDEALAWDPRRRVVPDHRLQTLMQHFSLSRQDTHSGRDMVIIYERWLHRHQIEDRQTMLEHNADDLLKLPELSAGLMLSQKSLRRLG